MKIFNPSCVIGGDIEDHGFAAEDRWDVLHPHKLYPIQVPLPLNIVNQVIGRVCKV